MEFDNVYEDAHRAEAYAKLEFPGTYYLAYRDLPDIITEYVTGNKALDFGCGTGRSTRYLKSLRFNAIGIDISEAMLKKARASDPGGDYRLVRDGDLGHLTSDHFDLALSAFTFDNIPTAEKKLINIGQIKRLLRPGGIMINLVSSPEIYIHEWASFTTKDFPKNKHARTGDKVKIIMKDVDDKRPVEDVIWMDEAYLELYMKSGLTLLRTHQPLARKDEPYQWVNELNIAPWTIYVLEK
ncbi:MAG: class I SAM-dependent methyltransferase [Candidatus Zixiibacteriota bacterium]